MKTLSFVIPVYNEEKRLKKTFKALSEGFSFAGIKLEKIIFVDDGSTDNTKSKVKSQKSKAEKALNAKVEVISYRKNQGKGHAIRVGLNKSKSDYTLFFDADMSTPLSEFTKFLPYIKQNADVVVGTRKNGHSTVVKHQPLYRELLGRGFTLLSQLILNTWVTDFTCGFKLFSRQAIADILPLAKIDRWSYDAELLFLSRSCGYTIYEKAVTWSNDERTKVNLFKDLPKTLFDLVYIRASNLSLSPLTLRKPALYTNS